MHNVFVEKVHFPAGKGNKVWEKERFCEIKKAEIKKFQPFKVYEDIVVEMMGITPYQINLR